MELHFTSGFIMLFIDVVLKFDGYIIDSIGCSTFCKYFQQSLFFCVEFICISLYQYNVIQYYGYSVYPSHKSAWFIGYIGIGF